jgi:tetratricopeptide (TPR) repeat protein
MRMHSVLGAVLLVMLGAVLSGCGGGESRKAEYVEQGRKYMAERNYTKARLEFRSALQIDPKDAQVRALVGIASEKLGEYDDAVKAYRVALAADESLVEVRARLARILAVAGLPDEAMELLNPGLEKSPDSADLLSVRAVVEAQRGDLTAARKDAEQAYELKPGDADVVATLAGLSWQANEPNRAVELVRKGIAAQPDDVDLRLLHARLLLAMDKPAEAERELVEVVRLDPSKVEHRSLLAQVYMLQGKADQAIDTVRAAVKADPERVETKLALARLLVALKSFDEAEKQLEAFRSESPKDQELLIGIADFYVANGRPEHAEEIYRVVIKSPATPARGVTARSRLAALELRKGRVDEASRLVSAVLAENPSDAEALVVRADIALQRGDAPAAVNDLRTAFGNQSDSVPLAVALAKAQMQAGQPELAEQTLRAVVQASPRNVQARFALAQFLIDAGRIQQARPVLEQLVADQPDNLQALEGLYRLQVTAEDFDGAARTARTIQALQPGGARGLYLSGIAYQRKGQDAEARQAFEQSLSADPKAIEPLAALVAMDLKGKQPELALARLERSIAATPGNSRLLAMRGDVLLQMQRWNDAAASFSAAAAAAPNWPPAYRGQALAYVSAEQYERAAAALESGLKATNDSPLIAMELIALYSRLGRGEDAIALAQKALDREPGSPIAANNLAMMLASFRTDAQSLERAESLIRQFADSTNPSLVDTYGWVLYKRGKHAEAVKVFQRVVAQAPDTPAFRYHLGLALAASGEADAARASLEAALAGGLASDDAQRARAELRKLP